MLYATIIFLFLLTVPAFVLSMQCYLCPPFTVNYLVTSDTVPSFPNCTLVNGTACEMVVIWNLNEQLTGITVRYQTKPPTSNVSEDILEPIVAMAIDSGMDTPLVSHEIFFACMTSERCNDPMNLKRVLHSLELEEKFRQELSPLIQIVSPFDAKSAACVNFQNTTGCFPEDLDHCQRCEITVDYLSPSGQEVCATCPEYPTLLNGVSRWTLFSLTNRTQLIDEVRLGCQLKGCNSMENIDRIYKASTISFNFGKYFTDTL